MTDAASRGDSAGALLRAAREKQGLHIAALAASIKVQPRKLEALEAGRYEELSGAIFTRALAQSVCRALRIDAAPVLALLPPPPATELDNVTGTLNAPFRDRSSRDEGGMAVIAQRWLIGGSLLLLIAAAVTYFLPELRDASPLAAAQAPGVVAATAAVAAPASAPAASADPPAVSAASAAASMLAAASAPTLPAAVPSPTEPASAATAQVEVTHLAPALPSPSAPIAGVLQLSTIDPSWIEVRDAQGRLLLSRTVLRGEAVGVDGAMPLRLTIGNASGTQVRLRGQPVDLAAATRDNVARLELR